MRPLLAFASLVSASLAADPILLVSPTNIVIGKEYSILVQDPACLKDPTKAVFKIKEAFPSFGLAPGLVFSDLTEGKDRCEFTYTLKVGNDAQMSTLKIPLYRSQEDNEKKILQKVFLEMVPFNVNSVQKGAIPPGVDSTGVVDVAYAILPYRVTADSFGRRLAETYFAVQATIGNSTGYSLLLTSLFFSPKVLQNISGETGISPLTPNTQYGMVRSTLEREQQVGRRAVSVNIARGIIPMLSTAGALVAQTAAADFAVATGMYGLTEKLFELIYPDKTVRQLVGLDTRAFRDGMVLKNNDQRPILFFIHREIVMCARKVQGCPTTDALTFSTADLLRLKYDKEFNPAAVKIMLGKLTIVGEAVTFSNRIVVTSIDESKVGVSPPATIYAVDPDKSLTQGDKGMIKLSGINLDTITVASSSDALANGITIGTPKVTSDKAAATIEVSIADEAKPGSYPLSLGAAGLARLVMLTITPATPEPKAPTPSPITIADNASQEIIVTGKYLVGATIHGAYTPAPADPAKPELNFSDASCGKGSCKIIVKAKLSTAVTAPKDFVVKLVIKKDNVADVAVPTTINVKVTK